MNDTLPRPVEEPLASCCFDYLAAAVAAAGLAGT